MQITDEQRGSNFTSRLNRTFARRIGKSLSQHKQDILEQDLPKHIFSSEILLQKQYNGQYFLEIGFGMGEHFLAQLRQNPNDFFIGAEVYLNGVAKVLQKAKEQNLVNFVIWPNDLDMILETIPNNSLHGIYILFPDPWHKRRYLKKRLFNFERLQIFKEKLINGGFIAFASDIEDYFAAGKELLIQDTSFTLMNPNHFLTPHAGYIQTKYHSKAIKEGRTAQFIQAKIIK